MSGTPNLPQPDPALKRLDHLVGTWSMEGNLVGSDETTIRGETTFSWLPGGFFLEQHAHLDFAGLQIHALELIGYDPETDSFPSTVFSNFSPEPLPYRWTVLSAQSPCSPRRRKTTDLQSEPSRGHRPNPAALTRSSYVCRQSTEERGSR
jgi:hypothetical protein